MLRRTTERGFTIYTEFADTYDNQVRVQESSAGCGPRVWIFSNNAQGESAIIHLGSPQACTPHLDPKQAREVARALLEFADENDPEGTS